MQIVNDLIHRLFNIALVIRRLLYQQVGYGYMHAGPFTATSEGFATLSENGSDLYKEI